MRAVVGLGGFRWLLAGGRFMWVLAVWVDVGGFWWVEAGIWRFRPVLADLGRFGSSPFDLVWTGSVAAPHGAVPPVLGQQVS